ncbi:MAG: zinc ribbon domain-containing protein [Clostridiales bacterium]|nr:zinc ribbon domain-containing protein [Clostridiales bacterium]
MARKKSNKIPVVILVLIFACLLFAMFNSLSTIVLGLWGDTVMGTVDSYDSRLDDSNADVNRSRTVSKGYYFTVNGKEYRGYVMFASDEAWPRLKEGETRSEEIRYLPFFPYINKPSELSDFDQMGEAAIFYHILSPIGCLFLLLLVTGAFKRKKKPNKAAVARPQSNNSRSDTEMFCHNCGSKLPEGVAFCIACGAPVIASPSPAPTSPSAPLHQACCAPPQNTGMGSTGKIGFSELFNHPEILAAAQKNKKSAIGCLWILVLVPLISFPIAGLLINEFPFGESLVIGIGLALIMLIANLIALSRKNKPMWEGFVVNKYSKKRSEHRGGEDDNYRTYTEFNTVINTDAGKKKTIVERDSRRHMYDYLSVGDKVRFHPAFGTYEKYDKSGDIIIYCNVCSAMNPIRNDRCKRCSNLLFK